MKPTPTPPERVAVHEQHTARSRVSYPWQDVKIGEWQEWQNLPAATASEAHRAADSLRAAARHYAKRNGLKVTSRSVDSQRVIDLLFTVDPEAGR